MIAIELLRLSCLLGTPYTLDCQGVTPSGSDLALRFIEQEIAATREMTLGAERTYQVCERTAMPGLDNGAITEINRYLKTLGCEDGAVAAISKRLDLRVRPPQSSTATVHVALSATGGNAIVLKEHGGLGMWAEWSVPGKYRMDFFPAPPRAAGDDSVSRIQAYSFDSSSVYDPLGVRVGNLRELLDWGLANAARGACEYSTDAGMESLRVRWTKSKSEPLPIRIGLHLAFSYIGQEIEFNLQRAHAPPTGWPISQLQVVQLDRSGHMLRCEDFQWYEALPTSLAISKTDFFPGERSLFRSTQVAIVPEPSSCFMTALAAQPSRIGSDVMDWRIDGELGEYRFQGELPSLTELQAIVVESKKR